MEEGRSAALVRQEDVDVKSLLPPPVSLRGAVSVCQFFLNDAADRGTEKEGKCKKGDSKCSVLSALKWGKRKKKTLLWTSARIGCVRFFWRRKRRVFPALSR